MTSRTRLISVVVLAIAGGHAAPAGAQSDDARSRAKALTAEGRRLYEQGDYEGALRKFSDAFDVFPAAKIQFNLGQAYRGLARDVEAIAAFEEFLARERDADPGARDEASRYVAELRKKVASVDLTCDVEGATVLVDGRRVGTTPIAGPILVAAGPHQIVVQKEGSQAPYVGAIAPERGGTVHLWAQLGGAPGAPRPVPVPAERTLVEPGGPPAHEPSRPVHTRWWFWTAIGVAVVGASVAAVAARKSPGEPSASLGTQKAF